jgi:hypothetical protein
MFVATLQIEIDLFDIAIECFAIVVAYGQANIVAQKYTTLSDGLDMLQIDDIRTVDSHKIASCQDRLDILQTQQRRNNLSRIKI